MNSIKIFESEGFGQVRVLTIADEPWFVAVDVCRALDIKNGRDALNRLDEDEKMSVVSTDAHSGRRGGAQQYNVINEPGLYALILGSRKPEAKAFKRWITHEVIPAVRKHGGYLTDQKLWEIATSPEVLHKLTGDLLAERRRNDRLTEENQLLQNKAQYYDCFIDAETYTNLRETAKELAVSERKLARFLIDAGFAYRAPAGHLLPYAKPANEGLFVVKDYCRNGHCGAYMLITPQGKMALYSLRHLIVQNT